jgi:hypothetical protein
MTQFWLTIGVIGLGFVLLVRLASESVPTCVAEIFPLPPSPAGNCPVCGLAGQIRCPHLKVK